MGMCTDLEWKLKYVAIDCGDVLDPVHRGTGDEASIKLRRMIIIIYE